MDIPIESINLQMLNVGFAQHDSDWNWQHVCSPFIRIYMVTEGSAKVHTDKSIIELKPGFLYMIPAFLKHSYEFKEVSWRSSNILLNAMAFA